VNHEPGLPMTATPTGAAVVDLRTTPIDPRAAETLAPEDAERLGVLPFAIRDGALVVAVGDPSATAVVEEVQVLTGRQVLPAVADRGDLDEAIRRYRMASGPARPPAPAGLLPGSSGPPPGNGDHRPALTLPPAEPVRPAQDLASAGVIAPADPTAVPAGLGRGEQPRGAVSINELLDTMLSSGASDLHLTAEAKPTVRVHGSLRQLDDFPVLKGHDLEAMLYSILPQRQREKFENDLELDCAHTLPGKARFRLNVYQQRNSVGAAFRVIPVDPAPLEDLGLPKHVGEFARLARGLVLVTGPTGSGKSTTLASMVDLANRERAHHIMTVEDPIEFLHKHKRCIINQREVGEDTRSFASALKHVLRQDPDIIMIGELRDLETISIALTAAETGHLVFATLHTQDAPQTIDRVIDVFPTSQQQQVRVQLAGALQGVVCQQLVPTADGGGRVVAAEVLTATPAIRNLIREAKIHQVYSAMQAGAQHGMQTMDQCLADLVKRGTIAYELGLERCHHAEDFKRLLGHTEGAKR
jgi:twitching motility protein PilT